MENTKKTGIRALAWVLAFALIALSIPLFTIVPNVTASAEDSIVASWQSQGGVNYTYVYNGIEYINVYGGRAGTSGKTWKQFANEVYPSIAADEYMVYELNADIPGAKAENVSLNNTGYNNNNASAVVEQTTDSYIRIRMDGPFATVNGDDPGLNLTISTGMNSKASQETAVVTITVYKKGAAPTEPSESGSSTTEDEPSSEPGWQLIWEGDLNKNFAPTSTGTGYVNDPELHNAFITELTTYGASDQYKIVAPGATYTGESATWLLFQDNDPYVELYPNPALNINGADSFVFNNTGNEQLSNNTAHIAFLTDENVNKTIYIGHFAIYAWRTAATDPEEPEPEIPDVEGNILKNGNFSVVPNNGNWTIDGLGWENGGIDSSQSSFVAGAWTIRCGNNAPYGIYQTVTLDPEKEYTLSGNISSGNAKLLINNIEVPEVSMPGGFSYTFQPSQATTTIAFGGYQKTFTITSAVLLCNDEPSESETEPTEPTQPSGGLEADGDYPDATGNGGHITLGATKYFYTDSCIVSRGGDNPLFPPQDTNTTYAANVEQNNKQAQSELFRNPDTKVFYDIDMPNVTNDSQFKLELGYYVSNSDYAMLRTSLVSGSNIGITDQVPHNQNHLGFAIDAVGANAGPTINLIKAVLFDGRTEPNVAPTEPEIPAEVKDAKYSASLTLNDNININFKMTGFGDGFDIAKLAVTVNDSLISLSMQSGAVVGLLAAVSPDAMADGLDVVVKYNDIEAKAFTYSVRAYCESVFGKYGATDALYKLCEAVLNYGAATAVYTNGSEANKAVNKDHVIDFSKPDYIPKSNLEIKPGDRMVEDGASCQLTLDSTITMVIHVEMRDGKTINTTDPTNPEKPGTFVILSSNNTLVDRENIGVTDKGNNKYTIEIRNITSSKLARTYTLMFWDDVKNAKDLASVASSLTFGVYNYCYAVQQDTTGLNEKYPGLLNLCKAIYNYGQAAKTYKPDTTA